MQPVFAADLDIGERLYARNTAASLRKRANSKNTAVLDAAWNNFREQGIDVKAEVDRMFNSIMESIEQHPNLSVEVGGGGEDEFRRRPFEPLVIDENTDSRIAATKALMKNFPLSMHRRNTFGSGRSGMSEPVKKMDDPGPGQYYPEEEPTLSARGSQRCGSSAGRCSTASSRATSERLSATAAAAKKKPKGYSFSTSERKTFEGVIPSKSRAQQLAAPGPGEYKVPGAFESTNQSTSKKGTFGAAPRIPDRVEVTPGPGSYALETNEKKANPGGGSSAQQASPKAGFCSSSPRMPSPSNRVPGPGAYHQTERGQSPPPMRDTPMYSFPKAEAKGPETCTPGPGTYDITLFDAKRDDAARGGIPLAGRDDGVWGGKKKLEEVLPGPGAYNPAVDMDKSIGVTLKFRHEEKAPVVPGPGEYRFEVTPNGPKWTMTGRRPQPEQEVLPGPADYAPEAKDTMGTEGPAAVFGQAKRDVHEDIASKVSLPGPAEYVPTDPRDVDAKNIVFGTSKQRPEFVTGGALSAAPGPGFYSPTVPQLSIPAPIVSTAPRFMPTSNSVAPGPGYYDAIAAALVEAKRAPMAVIGDGKRETGDHFVNTNASPIGPGEYSLPKLDSGPQYSMGLPLAERAEPQDSGLGPGAYAVPLSLIGGAEAHAAVLGTANRFVEAQEEKAAKSVPGPGAYDPRQDEEKRAPVFGTAPKEAPVVEGAPVGPGAYEPSLPRDRVQDVAFSTAPRFTHDRIAAVSAALPGPGAYEPQTSTFTGPAVVIGTSPGHEAAVSPQDVPGPGSYSTIGTVDMVDPRLVRNMVFGTAPQRGEIVPKDAASLPAPGDYAPSPVTPHVPTAWINSRPIAKEEETPGPGLYYVTHLADPVAPSAVFGSLPARAAMRVEDTPGPGTYHIFNPDGSPSALFPSSARFPDAAGCDIPGPGSYEPVVPGGPAVVIGTSSRPDFVSPTAVPGPGAYNPSDINDTSPQFSINAAPRPADRPSDAPGPGAYTPQPVGPAVHSTVFGGGAARPKTSGIEMPGPGAYEVPRSIVSGPAVSFPLASRTIHDPREGLPGPGYYTVVMPDGTPQVHFLTALRDTNLARREDIPGPGQYSYHPDGGHQSYSFPLAAARPPQKSDVPGPGAYEAPSSADAKAFSFGTGPQHISPSNPSVAPGPGAYDAASARQETPAYSFGKWSRDQVSADNRVPGPGAYQVGASSLREGPAFSVGTAPRAYFAPTSEAPGPGAYAPADVTPAPIAYSVPKSVRFAEQGSDVPGPGAYDAAANRAASNMLGAMIGTSGRETSGNREYVPGPGAYDPLSRLVADTPSFSLGTLAPRFTQPSNDVPGPAAYNVINPAFEWAPAAMIGTSHRFARDTTQDIPGPGAYDVASPRDGPAVSMAMAPRPMDAELQRRAHMPGPGHYDPNNYAAEGPSFTFAGRGLDPLRNESDLPGPGQYSSPTAFGDDARGALIHPLPMVDPDGVFARRVNSTPGPTAYMLPTTLDPRAAPIGTAARDGQGRDERAEIPGPGAYMTSGVGMFDGPKYTIPKDSGRGDGADDARRDMPGPGSYDATRGFDRMFPATPVYSFPVAERDPRSDGENRTLVGPGAYEIGKPPHAGPAYSFPQAADFASGGAGRPGGDAPGPGMYFSPTGWGLGGHTIGGKWNTHDPSSGAPGPGHYRMHDYDPYSRDRAVAIDFSKGGERPCNVKVENVYSDMPGPGQYFSGAIQFGDGRGVTILERLHAPFVERTPGPPDYHKPVQHHPFFDPLSH